MTFTLPAHDCHLVRTLTDQQSQNHTIEVSNDTFLLDGHQATIQVNGAELHVATEQGICSCTAQAFWRAFAGGAAPTETEAGLLLADSLMRSYALQHMHHFHEQFLQRICEQVQAYGSVPLPSYRLDPFIEQALTTYDGTPETTQLLARILKQNQETIVSWATMLGKEPPSATVGHDEGGHLHVPPQQLQVRAVHQDVPYAEASMACQDGGTTRRGAHRHFTEAQLERIRTEYAETSCVRDCIEALARDFGCPNYIVKYQIYTVLKLPKRHVSRQARETPSLSADDGQEGD